ncbi:hypothetical protein CcaCcLH18_06299 [Colletotrichum camelliae]|nr:hypothetical protein CcaCcLH18_06299 [Colletotrichum camelliae]
MATRSARLPSIQSPGCITRWKKGMFKDKYKKPLQALQLTTLIVILALVCVRLSTEPTAFDVLTLDVTVLSFSLLAYQLITQNCRDYIHIGTPKTYFVINAIETGLWTVVAIVGMATNIKKCTSGPDKGSRSCQFFFGLSAISGIVSQITGYTMMLYKQQWRSNTSQPVIGKQGVTPAHF